MRSRTRTRRPFPVTATVLGVAAVLAVAVAGFTSWPPARALAATTDRHATGAVLLGVDESTAVAIGPRVPIGDKFAVATTATATSGARLMAPAAKRKAKVVEKRAGRSSSKLVVEKKVSRPKAKKVARKAPSAKKAKAKVKAKTRAKKAEDSSRWRKARVSWYGPGLYGNGMAGGGKLKRDSMVVAHRSLKFGTKVKFTYKGRSVTAVVRDRGPFIKGRTFDLGPGTAKALRFNGVGTIKYKIIR